MRENQKLLLIFGCGGHARSVADAFLAGAPAGEIVFVDAEARPGETILGFPVFETCPSHAGECFIAIGDNALRQQFWEQNLSKPWATIVAPTAHLGREVSVGNHVFVGHFAHIGPEARVGNNTIVNTGVIIEHETTVGSHCHIAPHATVCGRCRIGDNVFIGAGATVKDGIHIASNVVVGAGAVVVKNMSEPGIYIGVPAKPILHSSIKCLM